MGKDVAPEMSAKGGGTEERFPLTDAQAEKWLGSHYSAQAAQAYGEAFELVFDGALDVSRFQAAFDATVARHQALAVRFASDGQSQIYEPEQRLRLRYLDLAASGQPFAEYRKYCERWMRTPFDIGAAPLARACLYRISPTQHRLFMSAHHLVVDGWSLRVVLKEMAAHYNAATVEQAMRIPPADSWAEFARAERARREGPEGQRCLRYWCDQFRELPEPLRLPTDRARATRICFDASSFVVDIDPELWRSLRDAARKQSVTRFALLLAGYFALLYRLTGQTDLVCGIPFAGAARGSGARVVGDTDNTLPLRVRVDPGQPLAVLSQQVQARLKAAAEHQDISLGRIVDTLPLQRSAGRMLLLESIVTLAPAMDRLGFDGVACELNVMPRLAAAWELGFYWRQVPGALVLEVQYQSELYDSSTVRSWADLYVDLLGVIAENSTCNLDEIDLAVRSPQQDWALVNDVVPAWSDAPSVPVLLGRSLAEHADRCAAECAGARMDYAELDRRSRRMAAGLLASGVSRGELVGIALPRSLDMLVAVLAVLRAGAAYVPLDPAFPEQRLSRMATHSGLDFIVAARDVALPESVYEGRMLRHVDALESMGDEAAALPDAGPDDLAYVLYTSGSTGEPKGVRILHRNLVNFLCAMRESPGFGRDDILCAATTLSFDIAALELYLPLLCGGRVVIADDNEHRDPEALCRLIERSGCTVLQTTPSLIALLQEVGRAQVLAPLRLLVGGEALSLPLAEALSAQCRELWNMYGPTETTVWSSIHRVRQGGAAVSLGQPIARTRLYVLDDRRRPALPHALGEIWIGGTGVADGYLNRPDLTAERFIIDPFAADGSRMYRTGDLGRLHDGQLYFHGRADGQIKLRGYRIEPGEIEAVAAAEPGVTECVAVVRRLDDGDQVLVLYVGSDSHPGELAAALRTRMQQLLPAYMRPQYVEVLRRLPKTPNGKIDRHALPLPSAGASMAQRSRVAPRTALERELCVQWQQLLRCGPVGVEDDFFELGGYSLLAVRMFAELQRRHGVSLPLATLIECPTVAALAKAVTAATNNIASEVVMQAMGNDSRLLVALRSDGSRPPLFLFHAVGGNVLNYRPLLEVLDNEQPVYGLQSPGLDGVTSPLESISAMADAYAEAIMRVHPSGPCMLAGGSMGGILALEVARRLRWQGREIALLAMFDTYEPGAGGIRAQRSLSDVFRSLADMGSRQREELWRRLRARLLHEPWARLCQAWRPQAAVPLVLRLHRVEQANRRALASYSPERYVGDVQLFRTFLEREDEDATQGWCNWIEGRIEVHQLPGRHHDFTDQPEVARCLEKCIAMTLRAGRPGASRPRTVA